MFLDDLRFSLNATMPVFLMMVFGYICRRIGLLDEHTTSKVNRFTFRTLLPALLFADLSKADFRTVWDSKFVLFCVCVTLLSILTAGAYSLLHKDKAERGEIIQASYRSSAAVLGIAFVRNIYGDSLMAALMVLGTVPLYNIAAVTVLSLTSPEKKDGGRRSLALSTVKGIATNPIILGIVVGMAWSLLRIPQPVILERSVSYLANMATPLSLIALGASFRTSEAKGRVRVTVGIAFIKLVLFCAVGSWCSIPACGGISRLPRREADSDTGNARQRDHGKLLRNGEEPRTQGRDNGIRGNADNAVQRLHSYNVAVPAQDYGSDMI